MDPLTVALLAGTGGTVLGGLLGNLTKPSGGNSQSLQGLSSLLAASAPVPTLQDLKLEEYKPLEDYQYVGDFDPENMSPTELRNILINQKGRDAQFQTLSDLDQIANEDGLTAIDRAQLEELRSVMQAQERGSREAIQQNMAARGMAGSGSELASSLLAQQESANRASMEGTQVAAQAKQRALQAMLQRGELGGNLVSQDYAMDSNRASAQDRINQFNTENRNTASAMNLANRQGILDRNTGQRNQISLANTDLRNEANRYNTTQKPVAQYGMASQNAGAASNAVNNQAQSSLGLNLAQSQHQNQLLGAGMQTGGMLGGAYMMYGNRPGTATG